MGDFMELTLTKKEFDRKKAVKGTLQRLFAWLAPYLYIAPAMIFFSLFLAYPVYFALKLSFYDWNGLTGLDHIKFIGLSNYQELVGDKLFWLSFWNTVKFSVVTTIAQMVLSFFLAFALWYFPLPFKKTLRSLIFFPGVVSMVILGLIWREMLSSEGLVNGLLSAVTGSNMTIQWLGNPNLVMWTVMAVDTWIFTGTNMVLWLAGMLSIPKDLIDAAKIDGANIRQLVWYVVSPLLKHVYSLSLLLNFIGGFQAFAIVYVTTRGGPAHLSEVLATYVFWLAFYSAGPQRFGYASAVASIIVIILLIFSYTRIRMSNIV
jgi:ABC-type sugar transport system permease subunit